MNENLIHTEKQSNLRNKIIKFYGNNKVLIFSFLAFLIVFAVIFTFYIETNEKKKKVIAENYITAKIYLENGNTGEALNLLKSGVLSNDPAYSTLCLFLILNENLITDNKELSVLFDHLLSNNTFDKETKNLKPDQSNSGQIGYKLSKKNIGIAATVLFFAWGIWYSL